VSASPSSVVAVMVSFVVSGSSAILSPMPVSAADDKLWTPRPAFA
jgi:hypothetical protein